MNNEVMFGDHQDRKGKKKGKNQESLQTSHKAGVEKTRWTQMIGEEVCLKQEA